MHTCAFSDEINFEKFKKVAKKTHRTSWNVDPCNPNFLHDKSELEVVCFLNHFQDLVGGDGIPLQNGPNYDELI